MAFSEGEIIQKFILPMILMDLRNIKADFMAKMYDAPQRAISAAGIEVNKVGQPISVDWNTTTAFDDADLVRFLVEGNNIPWEYFTTTPFMTDKEELRTSGMDREGILQTKSREAIQESRRDLALQNLAPADDQNAALPFMRTTGDERVAGSGVRALTIEDVIRFAEKYDNLNLTKRNEVFTVLCNEHKTDLAIAALKHQDFREIYSKTANGEPIPFQGFGWFWNNKAVHYAADNTKKADGAALIGTDRPASISFYAPHTLKALYNLEGHYKSKSEDTRNNPPQSEGRWTGNAIQTVLWNYGHGALVSGTV